MQDTSSSAASPQVLRPLPSNAITSGAVQSSTRKRLASAAFTEDSADPIMALKTIQAAVRLEDPVKDGKRLKTVGESFKMTNEKSRSLKEDGKIHVVERPAETEKEVKELDRAGGDGRGSLASSFPMTPGSALAPDSAKSESAFSMRQTTDTIRAYDADHDTIFRTGTRHGGIGWTVYGDSSNTIPNKMAREKFALEVDQIMKGDYTVGSSDAMRMFALAAKELQIDRHTSLIHKRRADSEAQAASLKADVDTQRLRNEHQASVLKNERALLEQLREQLRLKQNLIAESSKNSSASFSATAISSPSTIADPAKIPYTLMPSIFRASRPPATEKSKAAAVVEWQRNEMRMLRRKREEEEAELGEGDIEDPNAEVERYTERDRGGIRKCKTKSRR